MKRALLLAFGVSGTACSLLGGIGDHRLQDDADAATGDGPAPPIDGSLPDTTTPPDEGAPPDSPDGDGGTDAPLDAPADGTPVVLARGLQRPAEIMVDSTSLYWVSEAYQGSPGAIMTMPKAGGDAGVLAGNRVRPVELRLDQGYVYFTDDYVPPDGGTYGLYRVPRTGGPVETIDADGTGYGYGALGDGTTMCSAAQGDGGARVRCSAKAPPPQTPCYPYASTAPGVRFSSITADSTYLYVTDTAASAIVRASIGDCTGASAAVFVTNMTDLRAIRYHGQFLIWITGTSLYHLDRTAQNPTAVFLAGGYQSLASLDGYETNGIMVTDEAAGIVSYVRNGTFRATIASGQGGPYGVDVDTDGTVYWTNRTSGQVMMLPPPF